MSLGPTYKLKQPLKSISNLKKIRLGGLVICSLELIVLVSLLTFQANYKKHERMTFISVLIANWQEKKIKTNKAK